jgi:hypothetical protein
LRHALFNIALDNSFAKMKRAGQVTLRPFIVLAHIDQHKIFAGFDAAFYISDVGFLNLGLRGCDRVS